ncbi:MAG: glycosyltransferase, partial [Chloroflexi bacterium]|nr:glycosyltransferase [Chloroflexota bacterium]
MNQDHPRVTIVTPTFNSQSYLGDLLELVDAQKYDNIEHVIVDGASADGTVDMIQKYAEDHNVNWISEPDESAVEATSKGLRMATGDIIVVVPSDDLIFPWTIQTVVDYFLSHPKIEVIHGDSVALDMPTGSWHLRLHKRFTYGYLARTQCLVPPATFFRNHVLAGQDQLDPTLHHGGDYDWFLRVLRGRKVVNVREFLAIFRKRPGAVNLREGGGADVERETQIARSRYIKTSGPAYWTLVRWDRIWGAIHRRIQIIRMTRLSRKAGSASDGLNPKAPWRHFLNAYSVSGTSTRELLATFLPGRSRYAID